jgi:mono/diheme cytochrome c family protein
MNLRNFGRSRTARAVSTCAGMLASLCLILIPVGPARSQSEGVGMFSVPRIKATSGKEIFEQICQGCHMPNAKGAAGAGKYPALAGDPALASAKFMAVTLLEGRRNMPKFGGSGDMGIFFLLPTLNDEQIAAVINYVRSNFGNHFKGSITPAEVKALRQPSSE